MKIITGNSEKGGCGKTTINVNLAAGLAQRGYNVLLIDADPQGHATLSLGLRKEAGFYNLLVRGDEHALMGVIREVPRPNYEGPDAKSGYFYILPGNHETYAVAQLVQDHHILADQLATIEGIDYVIIDTPPTPGLLMAVVYEATEYMLVPTQVELLSMDGMLATVGRVKSQGKQLLGIVPTMYEKQTNVHDGNLTKLKQRGIQERWTVYPAMSKRTAWREASNFRKSIFAVAPKSGAAREMWGLVERIEKATADAQA